MCDFFSGVYHKTEGVLWLPGVDSHEDILKRFNIPDTCADDDRRVFARFEITPPDDIFERDLTKWTFRVDECVVPAWWSESCEEMCRNALARCLVAHMVYPGEMRENVLAGEIVIAVGGSVNVVRQGGSVNVVRQGGSVNVVKQGGSVNEVGQGGSVNVVRGSVNEVWQGGSVNEVGQGGSVNVIRQGGSVNVIRKGGSVNEVGQGGSVNVVRQGGMYRRYENGHWVVYCAPGDTVEVKTHENK